jgi:hypothetical protein
VVLQLASASLLGAVGTVALGIDPVLDKVQSPVVDSYVADFKVSVGKGALPVLDEPFNHGLEVDLRLELALEDERLELSALVGHGDDQLYLGKLRDRAFVGIE